MSTILRMFRRSFVPTQPGNSNKRQNWESYFWRAFGSCFHDTCARNMLENSYLQNLVCTSLGSQLLNGLGHVHLIRCRFDPFFQHFPILCRTLFLLGQDHLSAERCIAWHSDGHQILGSLAERLMFCEVLCCIFPGGTTSSWWSSTQIQDLELRSNRRRAF